MREPQQTLQADEEVTLVVPGEEATLVSPRFDEEETLVARPVVPLDAEGAPPPVMPRPYNTRRRGRLALVLVSVLIGGVLGGAGLYLYQRQSQEDAAAASNPQPTTVAETQQPVPTPTAEAAAAPQPEAPAADAQADAGEVAAPPVVVAGDDTSDVPDARERESTPATERRDDAGGSASPRKRGKKGEHDDEAERPARARPRADVPVARDDSDARESDVREARRVDSIFYRPRRAERQAERRAARRARRDTDRLRRIFEGTPQ